MFQTKNIKCKKSIQFTIKTSFNLSKTSNPSSPRWNRRTKRLANGPPVTFGAQGDQSVAARRCPWPGRWVAPGQVAPGVPNGLDDKQTHWNSNDMHKKKRFNTIRLDLDITSCYFFGPVLILRIAGSITRRFVKLLTCNEGIGRYCSHWQRRVMSEDRHDKPLTR